MTTLYTGFMLMVNQIDLEDPIKEWDLHKQWFVWPHDIKVKLSAFASA